MKTELTTITEQQPTPAVEHDDAPAWGAPTWPDMPMPAGFDERRAAESARIRRQVTELGALAEAMAYYLPDWSLIVEEVATSIPGYKANEYKIEHAGGAIVRISRDRQRAERITFSTAWPTMPGNVSSRPTNATSITAAERRGPRALAADFLNRMAGDTIRDIAQVQRRIKDQADNVAEAKRFVTQVYDTVGLAQPADSVLDAALNGRTQQVCIQLGGSYEYRTKIKVSAYSFGTTIDMEISPTPDQALQILEILKPTV